MPAPMPIVGIVSSEVILAASSAGTHSSTIEKQPRLSSRRAWRVNIRGGVFGLSLHAEAAKPVDRLRRQTDVAHDWDARSDNVPDDVFVPVDTLELDRLRAARDESADRFHGGGDAFPKGEEGEVGDHELACCGTRDRAV